jgi:glycosyltransferase involved in cell wall biosynthesis
MQFRARAGSDDRVLTLPRPCPASLTPAVPRVSVVVPALNEATNLPYVLGRIPDEIHQVIVVDGHSVDDTLGVAKRVRPKAVLVTQSRSGKGNAIACGVAVATGDIIVTLDADGSADPGEIPRFVDALVGGADFAKGTRFREGGGSSDITKLRSVGNRVLCAVVNVLYGTKYTDLCYGYNAFWRHVGPTIMGEPVSAAGGQVLGDGFEVETLLNTRVARSGLVVTEVPSYEHSRIHGASNLNAVRDGMRVLLTIFAERVKARNRTVAAPGFTHEDRASGAAESAM